MIINYDQGIIKWDKRGYNSMKQNKVMRHLVNTTSQTRGEQNKQRENKERTGILMRD